MRIIICLLVALSVSAEIYRSVDENGNVVFADKPSPEAELITVDELQTIKPPPVGKFTYTPKEKLKPNYTSVSISSPQDDAAIRNNSGNITVNVAVAPYLVGSDNLVLYLDGKEILLGRSKAKAFSGLDRGSHQLRAAVKDAEGRIQISSPSVTFHLLRQSVNN